MNISQMMPIERHATNDNHLIQLPFGLLGFEGVKNYVLLTRPEEDPFLRFQMAEEPKRAFLVVPPQFVLADYRPDLA